MALFQVEPDSSVQVDALPTLVSHLVYYRCESHIDGIVQVDTLPTSVSHLVYYR